MFKGFLTSVEGRIMTAAIAFVAMFITIILMIIF